MKTLYRLFFCVLSLSVLVLLNACGSFVQVNQIKADPTATVNKSFQAQTSPLPTAPPYHCGAWSSNNAPGTYSVISIYARLTNTKNLTGVEGATAAAVVHFKAGDVQLDQQPVSDDGGYITFALPLQGRQPDHVPATVDVSFSVSGKTIRCSSAFFTPQ